MTWYNKIKKESRRGTDTALMDDYTNFPEDIHPYYAPTDPTIPGYSISKPNPYFGGKTRKTPAPNTSGYPTDVSSTEDDDGVAGTGYEEIQPGRTLLDDDIPHQGNTINEDERFVSYVDKLKIPGSPSAKLDKGKLGPHNMPHDNVFSLLTKQKNHPFIDPL